jgi:hypothetical protein
MEKREPSKDRMVRQSYNPGMAPNDVLSLLDTEIARLKVARALLAAGSTVAITFRKVGSPSKVQPASPKVSKLKMKRNLTPEGCARTNIPLFASSRLQPAATPLDSLCTYPRFV